MAKEENYIKNIINKKTYCFSLRQYELNQVLRVFLNSLQNTSKANPNINIINQ